MWLGRGRCRKERELAAELVEAGHDPLDVAAVAIKMARGEEKQRPIAPIGEVHEFRPKELKRFVPQRDMASGGRRPRANRDEGMVRLTLSAGRAHGIRPNDVVGSIAYHAEIPGYTIGAIRIQEQHTLFDVPEQFVAQVLAKAGSYRIRKQAVDVERAR